MILWSKNYSNIWYVFNFNKVCFLIFGCRFIIFFLRLFIFKKDLVFKNRVIGFISVV